MCETMFSATDSTDHKTVVQERRETHETSPTSFLISCLEALSYEQHVDVKPKQTGGLPGKRKQIVFGPLLNNWLYSLREVEH